MKWIKEANKIGKYKQTNEGFRIYIVKEPSSVEITKEINGELFTIVEPIKGEYVAIDSTGLTFTGWIWDIIPKIEKEIMRRRFSKRYGEELEWR